MSLTILEALERQRIASTNATTDVVISSGSVPVEPQAPNETGEAEASGAATLFAAAAAALAAAIY